MRVVLQRVKHASVSIESQEVAAIGVGVLVLLGIEVDDTPDDLNWLCTKLSQLRIFNDSEGKMNRSPIEVGAHWLVVSQFTLHASTRKGNRPSYIRAARPEQAIPLYEQFVKQLSQLTSGMVATGRFGADMQVSLLNDGPVTIIIDSKLRE